MLGETRNDPTPSKRCDFIDQLRGWAVIVMIEVHAVNVWLHDGMLPNWLSFLNGLVAPGFIMCAGYSLVLSTFRADGTLRPFAPTAKRLGFILFCAYALHAPSLTLASLTVGRTAEGLRMLFQIDVLQCIVFSLLILQGLARLVRRPMAYAASALALALGVTLAAPYLWRMGVADGWWVPIRGLINGNTDQGTASLFPLFPWFAFAAFGSVLGTLYRHFRVMSHNGMARWSETRWLVSLALLGGVLWLWGALHARDWLSHGSFPACDAGRLYNTTLPSVAERFGMICAAGATMGWLEMVRGRWMGPNWVLAASRESLLLYMLHLNLIFGLLLADPVRMRLGLEPHSLGWAGTLTLTGVIIGVNLAAGVAWQRIRARDGLDRRIRAFFLAVLALWFVAGGWCV
jgi:uncharacterized membrane protein